MIKLKKSTPNSKEAHKMDFKKSNPNSEEAHKKDSYLYLYHNFNLCPNQNLYPQPMRNNKLTRVIY